MQKIILYYRFAPVDDPEAVRLWQYTLANSLKLRGRIIIAAHGINGTLGGEITDLKTYIKQTKCYPAFKNTAFKWSDGGRLDFPRLSVKVRNEIVTFQATSEIKVDEHGIIGGGERLKPAQLHQLIKKKRGSVVFFDGRSSFEAAVGRFKNAVVPQVDVAKDFKREIESGKYDYLKDQPVVTYCTGGVRCEVLSLIMKNRGFREVYQLDGGIVNYGEVYGDNGLWEGSLYVFDHRMGVKFSDGAKDIGRCCYCRKPTSHYENCARNDCNRLILLCRKCYEQTLCPDCQEKTPAV